MITVVMTTYQPEGSMRAHYMKMTVESLIKHLKGDEFRLIIADDGSPEQDNNFLMLGYVAEHWGNNPIITNSNRSGVGGSLNLALSYIDEDDVWIYTTDDWLLENDLDVSIPVKLLRHYDYVRIGCIHPNVKCYPRFEHDIGWWLELTYDEGGFAFGTRPFLATRKFYNQVGPFKERCSSYDVETDYSLRVSETDIRLAHYSPYGLDGPFKHIGEDINSIGAKWP